MSTRSGVLAPAADCLLWLLVGGNPGAYFACCSFHFDIRDDRYSREGWGMSGPNCGDRKRIILSQETVSLSRKASWEAFVQALSLLHTYELRRVMSYGPHQTRLPRHAKADWRGPIKKNGDFFGVLSRVNVVPSPLVSYCGSGRSATPY